MKAFLPIIVLIVLIAGLTAVHRRIYRMLSLERRSEAQQVIWKYNFKRYDWLFLIPFLLTILAGIFFYEVVELFGYALAFLYCAFGSFRWNFSSRKSLKSAGFPQRFIQAQFAFGNSLSVLLVAFFLIIFIVPL